MLFAQVRFLLECCGKTDADQELPEETLEPTAPTIGSSSPEPILLNWSIGASGGPGKPSKTPRNERYTQYC
ncbi:hypothetical protein ANO14919_000630 [Xylariales sp. No.14919]|nr:hypothetical protein ANO14919_000630 [Xylariales sp. No.14919]